LSSILIAGASRGIGREFVRQLVEKGWRVLATARDQAGCAALAELGAEPFILDITDDRSIAALAANLGSTPLDAVLANAGISGDQSMPMEAVTWAEMHRVMDTNTLSAVLLVAALKPNLLAGERRLALGMSSLMSSISSNNWGTQYCYRASKTALNAMWRSLADEWRADGITCALLRPGFVKTDMTDHSDRGLDVDVSVAGMVRVIEQLALEDTGRCISFDGKDVPW